MEKVIPVIVICSVGIAACLVYIGVIVTRSLIKARSGKQSQNGKRPRNEFEIEDDTLTIRLGKRRKK